MYTDVCPPGKKQRKEESKKTLYKQAVYIKCICDGYNVMVFTVLYEGSSITSFALKKVRDNPKFPSETLFILYMCSYYNCHRLQWTFSMCKLIFLILARGQEGK